MADDIITAAYYFPNYHRDPRNELAHGAGWTEWDVLQASRARFDGHQPPGRPLWGCDDEADPDRMALRIDAAADHGLDAFVFDWYWYEDGPFLQRALENGFLNAPNRQRLKFALMWANHDWVQIHPARLDEIRRRTSPLLRRGAVSPLAFRSMTDRVIERFFAQDNYLVIGGKPFFSIYEVGKLIEGCGSLAETQELLDRFRDRVRAAGFPGLHLNAILWQSGILPGEAAMDASDAIRRLGFDSVGSYVWVHHARLDRFPANDYASLFPEVREYWQQTAASFDIPYFPNVTVGWDCSPRAHQDDPFERAGYPFSPVVSGATPERFGEAVRMALAELRQRDGSRMLTINAWNEWTEGSYLEPDLESGWARLRSLRAALRGEPAEAGQAVEVGACGNVR